MKIHYMFLTSNRFYNTLEYWRRHFQLQCRLKVLLRDKKYCCQISKRHFWGLLHEKLNQCFSRLSRIHLAMVKKNTI